jgi:hypothetical protein
VVISCRNAATVAPGAVQAPVTVTAPITASMPAGQPIVAPGAVQAHVEAPVAVTGPISAQADVDAHLSLLAVEGPFGPATKAASNDVQTTVTSQPVAQPIGPQTAGRDARQTNVAATLSGSAWPVVLVVLFLAAAATACYLARERARLRLASQRVGRAVAGLPPEQRIPVLGAISDSLGEPVRGRAGAARRLWDKTLDEAHCRLRRSGRPTGPAPTNRHPYGWEPPVLGGYQPRGTDSEGTHPPTGGSNVIPANQGQGGGTTGGV